MKKYSTLIAVSVLALVLSACMDKRSALDNPPGTYERTTSSTDANGTTTERKSSTEVSEDRYGNKKAVVKTKTTKDPKGLLNKTTTSESKEVIEENQ